MLAVEIQDIFAAVTAAHNDKNLIASYTLLGLKSADRKILQEEDHSIESFLKYWKRNWRPKFQEWRAETPCFGFSEAMGSHGLQQ